MTARADSEPIDHRDENDQARRRSLGGTLSRIWRAVTFGGFSSLTRRIVLLNFAALVVLVGAILVLNQQRAGLIDAEVRSLTAQGELIANSIAASATESPSTDALRRPPSELPGDLDAAADFLAGVLGLEAAIDPVRAGELISYLSSSAGPRVRVYDTDGTRLVDSDSREIIRNDLPPPGAAEPSLLERIWDGVTTWFRRNDLPVYRELGPTDGRGYEEVASALEGERATLTRVTEDGDLIVSVAIPISGYQTIQGAVLLTTREGNIDTIIREERNAILTVATAAVVVSVVLSFLLAWTIAAPLRRLSAAADHVRKGVRSRPEIPDFSARRDEIGDLSLALREMTSSLFDRIDAIERFAADVAHELKNPLTSLRSAVETLPLAKTPEAQKRLAEIIQHDIKRLDRLISDIADASRLDSELSHRDAEPIDLGKLLTTLANMANETAEEGDARVIVDDLPDDTPLPVLGHDIRLTQVLNNLIDNARSFSPAEGAVRLKARQTNGFVEIAVEDQGPGIKAEQFDRIFDRFYTDRPGEESFGQNSGLGLSISKQIVEAHGGRIWAENIAGPGGKGVIGARFVVRLPAAPH